MIWNNTNTTVFASKKKTKTPAYTFKGGNCAKEQKITNVLEKKPVFSLFF